MFGKKTYFDDIIGLLLLLFCFFLRVVLRAQVVHTLEIKLLTEPSPQVPYRFLTADHI